VSDREPSVGLPRSRWDFTADVPQPGELGRVHVLAVGGAGMSGVARLLAAAGAPVSGCDAKDSATLQALSRLGIGVGVGHDVAHLDGVDTLVVSSAIREVNPELAAARARGLRVLHRSQGLASAVADTACRIAVAGANGKTTTASMLAVALHLAGRDPGYVLGGEPAQLTGNAARGAGGETVIEADESDGSFVVYRPHVAIVTSVQPDHLDFYGDLEAVHAAYRAFVTTIEPGGLLVVCTDDPGAAALGDWARRRSDLRVLGYGTGEGCDVRLVDVRDTGPNPSADVQVGDAAYPMRLGVPGRHNLLNAAGAVAALSHAVPDTGPGTWVQLLGRFTGVARRFERVGERAGVVVVDDYAHNPAKVAAVVATGRAVVGAGRLVVVFQPHLYSRTRDFAAEFGQALAGADVVVLTDVYAAREDPLPGVTGELVADAVRARRPDADVRWVPELADLPTVVAGLAHAGDLVVTVGAGDVTVVGPRLLELLGSPGAGPARPEPEPTS